VFAFGGVRDALRIRAEGSSDGRPIEVRKTLPIRSEFSKNTYLLPLRGVSYVGWGDCDLSGSTVDRIENSATWNTACYCRRWCAEYPVKLAGSYVEEHLTIAWHRCYRRSRRAR
jgi:hypothetical protein